MTTVFNPKLCVKRKTKPEHYSLKDAQRFAKLYNFKTSDLKLNKEELCKKLKNRFNSNQLDKQHQHVQKVWNSLNLRTKIIRHAGNNAMRRANITNLNGTIKIPANLDLKHKWMIPKKMPLSEGINKKNQKLTFKTNTDLLKISFLIEILYRLKINNLHYYNNFSYNNFPSVNNFLNEYSSSNPSKKANIIYTLMVGQHEYNSSGNNFGYLYSMTLFKNLNETDKLSIIKDALSENFINSNKLISTSKAKQYINFIESLNLNLVIPN